MSAIFEISYAETVSFGLPSLRQNELQTHTSGFARSFEIFSVGARRYKSEESYDWVYRSHNVPALMISIKCVLLLW